MRQNDILFWIWLSEALGAANPEFRPLIDLYETAYEIFEADAEELELRVGLKEKTVHALSNKSLERAAEILDACERLGIGILPYHSELYPATLREIKNPPILLYYAGTIPKFEERLCVGLVGTRRMSAYGMEMAYKISYGLACGGAVTVSGLAEGIDGVCAAATLQAGGMTVAVLGCGLDRVYPAHHGKLMSEIASKGLLLSEYPPATKPLYYHFPARNRIISGLSHSVVVVEAGLGSGSLITAKNAVAQGKDVFAVPAKIGDRGAEGVNGLLRDGALFASCAEDVAQRYAYLFPSTFRIDLTKHADARSRFDLEYLRSIGVWNGILNRDAEPEPTVKKVHPSEKPVQKKTPSAATASKDADEQKQKTKEKPNEDEASDALLKSLSPIQLDVLKAIPDDRTVSADALVKLEHPYGEILTALTMLEIMGLVEKLPGAVYRKA